MVWAAADRYGPMQTCSKTMEVEGQSSVLAQGVGDTWQPDFL